MAETVRNVCRFDRSKIKQGTYILCHSEEEAKKLLSELEKIGYSWCKGHEKLTSKTYWSDAHSGKIAYYILDEQDRTLQYCTSDFDTVESSTVDYKEVLLEIPPAPELSTDEVKNIYELLDRSKREHIRLICCDPTLMQVIVGKALEYVPGNYREWRNTIDFNSFDAIYFDWDNYLIQTSSKNILSDEEYVVIDRKLLKSYGEYQDDEDGEKPCPHPEPEPQRPSKEPAVKLPQFKTNMFQPKSENKKEKTRMNIFGINNMEFGMNTDTNIISTFIGTAVKNGESWRVYDKEKKTLTDIGDMNIGGLPLFIMPSTKLEEGDLIKSDGSYYYVVEVNDSKVKTLSATTGKMEEVVPVDNLLGIRFYSKVIAIAEDLLSDGEDGENDKSMDKLMMAMAMSTMNSSMNDEGSGQNSQMLIPLLLLKDKGDSDDKKADRLTKFMLLSSMGASNGGQNAMLPLLLLKGSLL